MAQARARVSDMVRDLIPQKRQTLSGEESALGVHLRGNAPLYEAITDLIRSRLQRREHLPVPSDPLECKSILERDNELRWLLSRLDRVYRSPINEGAEQHGEQPDE